MDRDRELDAIGRAIRARRLELGLSQEAAAGQWSVSRSLISRLERGQANPSFRQLFGLAESMDVSLLALFQRAYELPQDDGDDG
ncbi:MAG: Helix-turn-helix domain [Solirubrobacteraceae bacterium]|jgi:transcriptional regulator with XRE-family HTH domain|nr:Helix-turn-helix domain [Solirubrobacteraceae bacterium]